MQGPEYDDEGVNSIKSIGLLKHPGRASVVMKQCTEKSPQQHVGGDGIQSGDCFNSNKQPQQRAYAQFQERMEHRRRLADGLSEPRMVVPSIHAFPDIYPEFADAFTKQQFHSLEKDFLLSDLDEDGVLNRTEIKYWMEKRVQPINERQLGAILANCDRDKDNALSFREFLYLCKHIQFKDFSQSSHMNHIYVASKRSSHHLFSDRTAPKDMCIPTPEVPPEVVDCKLEEKKPAAINRDFVQRNTSKQKIQPGKVKEAVNYFNEKIREATDEVETKRKQMEMLPLPKRDSPPGNSYADGAMCEGNTGEELGQSPPPPPPLPSNSNCIPVLEGTVSNLKQIPSPTSLTSEMAVCNPLEKYVKTDYEREKVEEEQIKEEEVIEDDEEESEDILSRSVHEIKIEPIEAPTEQPSPKPSDIIVPYPAEDICGEMENPLEEEDSLGLLDGLQDDEEGLVPFEVGEEAFLECMNADDINNNDIEEEEDEAEDVPCTPSSFAAPPSEQTDIQGNSPRQPKRKSFLTDLLWHS